MRLVGSLRRSKSVGSAVRIFFLSRVEPVPRSPSIRYDTRMRFLIELDGPVFDVSDAWYQAHRSVATAVGWSTLDQTTFWRLVRTVGAEANFLPSAKPTKLAEYRERFTKLTESDAVLEAVAVQPGVEASLAEVARFGPLVGITLGANLDGRRRMLARLRLDHAVVRLERLDSDPRRRPAELLALGEKDPHSIVLAGSDTVLRSADAAGMFGIGLSCGTVTAARLQRAGPRLVFGDLSQFTKELFSGGPELVRQGLLPFAVPRR